MNISAFFNFKKLSVLIVLVLLFIFMQGRAFAHPGNTAADGCHYCRTNCDKWGVPWNQRHCHGTLDKDDSAPEVVSTTKSQETQQKQVQVPKPSSIPTPSPSPSPIPTPSPSPTPLPVASSEPSPSPEVLGNTEDQTPPTETEITDNDRVLGLLLLGGIGIGGYKWYQSSKQT